MTKSTTLLLYLRQRVIEHPKTVIKLGPRHAHGLRVEVRDQKRNVVILAAGHDAWQRDCSGAACLFSVIFKPEFEQLLWLSLMLPWGDGLAV